MKIKWSKLFDWSVSGVARYPLYSAGKVLAYGVDVQYLHHGLRRVKFPVEEDRALVSGERLALSRASDFFDKMHAKMQRNMKTR